MKAAMVEVQRPPELTRQEWTVFTADQQLYRLAVNITWAESTRFHNFGLRLGGMHIMMSLWHAHELCRRCRILDEGKRSGVDNGNGIRKRSENAVRQNVSTKCQSLETTC